MLMNPDAYELPEQADFTATEAMRKAFSPQLAVLVEQPPDLIIHRSDVDEYLKRWWLTPRNRQGSVYLHYYVNGDMTEKPHNHPWKSVSYVLEGGYVEELFENRPEDGQTVLMGSRTVKKGHVVFRDEWEIHRIHSAIPGTVTLFLTGPVIEKPEGSWGFFEDGQFTHHSLSTRNVMDANDTLHSYPLEQAKR